MLIKDETESKTYVDALAAVRYRMVKCTLLFPSVVRAVAQCKFRSQWSRTRCKVLR
jgi:hypothetical protein